METTKVSHWRGNLSVTVNSGILSPPTLYKSPYVIVKLSTPKEEKTHQITRETKKASLADKPRWNTTFDFDSRDFDASKLSDNEELLLQFIVVLSGPFSNTKEYKTGEFKVDEENNSGMFSGQNITRPLLDSDSKESGNISFKLDYAKQNVETVDNITKAIAEGKSFSEIRTRLFHLDKSLINSNDEKSKKTILYMACENGRLEVVDYLIKNFNNLKLDGSQSLQSTNTPIHAASYNGHKEVLEVLLEKRNPERRNMDNKYPYEDPPKANVGQICEVWKNWLVANNQASDLAAAARLVKFSESSRPARRGDGSQTVKFKNISSFKFAAENAITKLKLYSEESKPEKKTNNSLTTIKHPHNVTSTVTGWKIFKFDSPIQFTDKCEFKCPELTVDANGKVIPSNTEEVLQLRGNPPQLQKEINLDQKINIEVHPLSSTTFKISIMINELTIPFEVIGTKEDGTQVALKGILEDSTHFKVVSQSNNVLESVGIIKDAIGSFDGESKERVAEFLKNFIAQERQNIVTPRGGD